MREKGLYSICVRKYSPSRGKAGSDNQYSENLLKRQFNVAAMVNWGCTYYSYNSAYPKKDPRVYAGKRTIVVYYLGPEVTN